jgi:hypothetical protein
VTNPPWNAVSKYLANLADAEPSAADYATKVRAVFDVVVQETGDAAMARDFFLSHISAQHQLGALSAKHRELVAKQLPKPAAKDAAGQRRLSVRAPMTGSTSCISIG